jgi:hypothetical protein
MERFRRRLLVAGIIIVSTLLLGTLLFHRIEGWSYVDSFYYTGITITTVGYGDFTPQHTAGKIAAVMFAFTGVGIIFYSVSVVAQRRFMVEEERFSRFRKNGSRLKKRLLAKLQR